jgi:hypothetical protein
LLIYFLLESLSNQNYKKGKAVTLIPISHVRRRSCGGNLFKSVQLTKVFLTLYARPLLPLPQFWEGLPKQIPSLLLTTFWEVKTSNINSLSS